jgi:nucleoside-diphosphate-sugar epimerase
VKILITGGAGFLGQELIASLAKVRSNQIYILDSFLHGSGLNTKFPKRKNVHPAVVGNVRNYYDLFRTIDRYKPDVIVHLAAYITRPESVDNFRVCSEINYVGMANLLDACSVVKEKPSKIIFASSEAARNPLSHHGISKRGAEDLLHLIAPLMGVEATSMRFSEIYGLSKSHSSNSMVNFLTDTMINGSDVALYNVNRERDMIHISDAVRACELVINTDVKGLGRIDIGSGKGMSVKDLAASIKKATGFKGQLKFLEDPRIMVVDSVADTVPAKEILGFECTADFDTELAIMVKKRKRVLK